MTPLPPACVAAVRELPMSSHPSDVARAVLDAFVAGEAKGLWKVEERPPEGLFRPVMRWRVARTDGSHWIDGFLHKAQAIGCAAVLNYLEAKGE